MRDEEGAPGEATVWDRQGSHESGDDDLSLARAEALASLAGESSEPYERLTRVANQEVVTAKLRARRILQNVRKEASRIHQEALDEAEALRARAVETSLAEAREHYSEIAEAARTEGLEAGRQEAQEELALVLQRIAGMADSLASEYDAYLRHSEEEMLQLVLEIAHRVIGVEQEAFRDLLGEAILDLVRETGPGSGVVIQVSSEDHQAIRDYMLRGGSQEGFPANLVPTSDLAPGGCRFTSRKVNLEFSFEKRFVRIREALERRWESLRAQDKGLLQGPGNGTGPPLLRSHQILEDELSRLMTCAGAPSGCCTGETGEAVLPDSDEDCRSTSHSHSHSGGNTAGGENE